MSVKTIVLCNIDRCLPWLDPGQYWIKSVPVKVLLVDSLLYIVFVASLGQLLCLLLTVCILDLHDVSFVVNKIKF